MKLYSVQVNFEIAAEDGWQAREKIIEELTRLERIEQIPDYYVDHARVLVDEWPTPE